MMETQTHKLKIVEFHQPDLEDGDYTITVTQSLSGHKPDTSETFKATASLEFSVLGPRYQLDAQSIAGVFPPPGSLGDHAGALPHILLKRSTLPWERKAIRDNSTAVLPSKDSQKRYPWLALLLFAEGELTDGATGENSAKTCKLSDLMKAGEGNIHWPEITEEKGQHPEDIVTVLDVPYEKLQKVLPAAAELEFLTHVRLTKDEIGKAGTEELAVVIGNRLPKAGSTSIVHLVSLEQRFIRTDTGIEFDYQKAKDGHLIRLVSLKSWRFACIKSPHGSFTGMLQHLNHDSAALNPAANLRLPQLPESVDSDSSERKKAREHAEKYLSMGSVPIPHAMRQGNKSVSWYRGPFVSGNNTSPAFALPIRTADDLICYDEDYGIFDVSYASAWELGRLLALQSKSFALSLYHWKRQHARRQQNNDAETQIAHLPFAGPKPELELPETVRSWFEHLLLLEDVPFHYLVPDERMLPPESIRFFQIDPNWMECLLDGAFSIGRVLQSDHKQDETHREDRIKPILPQRSSGFLLRSDLVAGWPGLQVTGYDAAIKEEGFSQDKKFLFGNNNITFDTILQDLQNKNELYIQSTDDTQKLAIDKCLIETRQWTVSRNQQLQYMLCKRENNEIAVCDTDMRYLFNIDAGYETELNENIVSAELKLLFKIQQLEISAESQVAIHAVLVTDVVQQSHYELEKAANGWRVYSKNTLPLLRMTRLSANILLCLFEGIVQAVDVHLKPETLHFGLNDSPGVFYKQLKANAQAKVDIAWKEEALQVINIGQLVCLLQDKKQLTECSVADFAYEMIANVEKVRFTM